MNGQNVETQETTFFLFAGMQCVNPTERKERKGEKKKNGASTACLTVLQISHLLMCNQENERIIINCRHTIFDGF